MQNDINREEAKISGWSIGKNDEYEYITGKEIFSSNQRQMIDHAKFTYSPLRKAFLKNKETSRCFKVLKPFQ